MLDRKFNNSLEFEEAVWLLSQFKISLKGKTLFLDHNKTNYSQQFQLHGK